MLREEITQYTYSVIPVYKAQNYAELTICCLDIQTHKAKMKTKRRTNTKLKLTVAQRRE